jgi:hypothetical protein
MLHFCVVLHLALFGPLSIKPVTYLLLSRSITNSTIHRNANYYISSFFELEKCCWPNVHCNHINHVFSLCSQLSSHSTSIERLTILFTQGAVIRPFRYKLEVDIKLRDCSNMTSLIFDVGSQCYESMWDV